MGHRFLIRLSACLLTTAILAAGCKPGPKGGGEQKPPDVTITPAVEREVTDSVEFPGRTAAIDAVEVRARVSGYLDKVNFQAGAEVKAGDVLFEIDPRIYQADYDKAAGQVAVYEAKVKRLTGDVERNAPLVARRTVSREDFEKMIGDRDEAIAGLKSTKANLEGSKVNLDFTKVRAPIGGKISRNLITIGNLVRADVTALANIVSAGKMYAYFDVDENTLLAYQRDVREGRIKPGKGGEATAWLTLGDGTVIKGGTVEADVQLNRGTGTMELRATFPDPDGFLRAGQFGRVRLPVGEPHKAVVVPEVAVGSDQGLKYVYVVDDQNKVEYRRVTVGGVQHGMQIIDKGLKPGELVIAKGLLRVRDGVSVAPKREDVAKQ